MPSTSLAQHLAVCSWSLQPASPLELVNRLESVGIRRVQLALDPLRENPAVWGGTADLFARAGMSIVSGMFGTLGEDYTTLDSIRRTGGLVPDEHWEANWRNIQEVVEIASRLRLSLVTFHAGFLPHDEKDPAFRKILERITRVADLFASRNLRLGFETGQETAETLGAFLRKLGRPNVGVNFDPANMILYDKGNPIEALRMLGPWLQQCHIKDANRTRVPGTWGDEVVVGTGQVDWAGFFRVLKELGFAGNLCLEREAGNQRVEDLRAARTYLEKIVS